MGKRNKKPNNTKEEPEIIVTKKPKKDRLDTDDVEAKNSDANIVKQSKKTKKHKSDIEMESKNKSKDSSASKDNVGKSNKIVFGDDGEPQEFPANSGATNSSKNKKNKKFLNDDEAEVKDEDIDKFCGELEEDDNVQYENWVKLIEEKLHSKKVK